MYNLAFAHNFALRKDRIVKEHKKEAIYPIPCNECDQEYIGQTKCQF